MRSAERVVQILKDVQKTPNPNLSDAATYTADNILRAMICVKLEELGDSIDALRQDNLVR